MKRCNGLINIDTIKESDDTHQVTKRVKIRCSDKNDETDNKFEQIYPKPHDSTIFILLNQNFKKLLAKVAAFDYDWTICRPKSGKTFAQGRNDWVQLYDNVPKRLKELDEEGYKIVFFTNQAGIEKRKINVNDLKAKFLDVCNELDISSIQVYVAAATNHQRKPFTSMQDLMVQEYFGEDCNIDLTNSFYVGDSAGRKKNQDGSGSKRDFSDSDRKFASNIGIKFFTPETFFASKKTEIEGVHWDQTTPSPLKLLDLKAYANVNLIETLEGDSATLELPENMQNMNACSGKTTFAKRFFLSQKFSENENTNNLVDVKNQVQVNRDTIKTKAACLKLAKDSLQNNKNVIIDNLNGSIKDRIDFIQLAREFQTSREIAEHLNLCRVKQTNGKVRRIPSVVYNTFLKRFEAPSKSEGFDQILKVNFIPKFSDDAEAKMFSLWT